MAKKKSTKKAATKKKAPSRPSSKAVKKAVKKPSKAKKAPAKKAKPAPKKAVKAKKPAPKAAPKAKKSPAKPVAKPQARAISGPVGHKPSFPIGRSKDKPVTRIPVIEEQVKPSAAKLNGKFLETQKKRLLELRDHILDQMQGVAKDGLRSQSEGSSSSAFGMHQADAGSEAYEKTSPSASSPRNRTPFTKSRKPSNASRTRLTASVRCPEKPSHWPAWRPSPSRATRSNARPASSRRTAANTAGKPARSSWIRPTTSSRKRKTARKRTNRK